METNSNRQIIIGSVWTITRHITNHWSEGGFTFFHHARHCFRLVASRLAQFSRYAPRGEMMKSEFVSRKDFESLGFYDSVFRSIEIFFSDGNARGCKIEIDYYDWEGNLARRENKASSEWTWKALTITFGYLAHFEYSMPDLLNRAQDIYELQFDHELERLREKEENQKQQFPKRQSPLFDSKGEALSLKFVSENGDEENLGYILVVGSDVTLEWNGFDSYVGQTHFPIDDDGA